jgi:hypothetical protein
VVMQKTSNQKPTVRASPDEWIGLRTGYYADPNVLLGADGKPLMRINFYQGHIEAKKLGMRLIDDSEYNGLVKSNRAVADQMCDCAVWTGLLKDVISTDEGYTAIYTTRPEVSVVDDEYLVKGVEKTVTLPKSGFFKIRELLESETGLPTKTYGDMPDEPGAYFWIEQGRFRPISRGRWLLRGRGHFDVDAYWEPIGTGRYVGARAVREK